MGKINRSGVFFVIIFFCSIISGFCDSGNANDLERIVVTKSRICLLNDFSADSGQIASLPITSTVESLKFLPVDLQSRQLKSGVQTDFSLRGSNFQGVLMLLNGQRINDPQTGHHNSDIPLTKDDIELIDVIPGAGASVFGPDAIGGAINILLKKPTENKIVFEPRIGTHQSGSGLFSITQKKDNLGVRLSVEDSQSDGFRYDTDFKKLISSFISSLYLPNGDFTTSFGYEQIQFGAFDFYTPGSGYPSKEWTRTCLLNTGLNLDEGGFLIKPNFLWRRHFDKFMLDKTQIRSTYLNHHRTDMFTPNIYFQKEMNPLGRVGMGLEYGDEKITSTNLGKHVRQHNSIYLDDSKDLNPRISLGSSLRTDDYDSFDRAYTGSFDLKYKLTEQDFLSLGVSRSMRVPSFTELYYNDPTTIGDPNLCSEKTINYQLGVNKQKKNFSIGQTVFFRNEKDMIDWVKTTPAQAKFQVANITKDYVYGTEFSLRLKLNSFTSLDWNYTYVNKQVYDAQGYIYKYGRNYIKHLTSGVFSFNLPFGVQTLGFSFKKKPDRRGWFLLDTHLAYDFNKHAKAFFNVTNLLNVEYQEIVGIPQPGRFMETGVRLEW